MTASELLNSEAAETAAGLAANGEPSVAELKAALVNALRRINSLEKRVAVGGSGGRKKADGAGPSEAVSTPLADPLGRDVKAVGVEVRYHSVIMYTTIPARSRTRLSLWNDNSNTL
jgi:hypothetical protein